MKREPQPERVVTLVDVDARLFTLECAFEEMLKGASVYFAVKDFEGKHEPPVH